MFAWNINGKSVLLLPLPPYWKSQNYLDHPQVQIIQRVETTAQLTAIVESQNVKEMK